MSTPNRELSQFGSLVSVNDTSKKISIGGTFTQVSSDNLLVSGISTLGFITANNSYFTGVVTATTFYGDLVGTASTFLTQVTIADYATLAGYANSSGIATAAQSLIGQSNINAGIITANQFYGNLTGTATTATDVIGGVASITSLNVTGISTLGSVKVASGIITASSGVVTYYGDGSKLSGIVTQIVAGAGITVTSSSGIVTISSSNGGAADSYWVKNNAGIHTLSNVGIGTTNPQTKLEVNGVLSFSKNSNILIGNVLTGANLTTGENNILIGSQVGSALTNSSHNVFIGSCSGAQLTTGIYNSFYGTSSGYYADSGSFNSFFGAKSGESDVTGCNNTFVGALSGLKSVTGSSNSFFGFRSGNETTVGFDNSFYGVNSGYFNKDGYYNSFFGKQSSYSNISGNNNIYIGANSGVSTSASRKVIIGNGFAYNNLFDAPDPTKNIQLAIGTKNLSNSTNYWIVGNENFNVGIGTTNPTSKLFVGGDALITGIVTANKFIGDGSGLSGITGVGTGVYIEEDSSFIGAATTINFGSNLSVSLSFGTATVTATGISSSDTYWVKNNAGIHTTDNVGIGSTAPSSELDVVGDGNFTGTVNANKFTGNGSQLTGIVTQINAGTGINVSSSTGSITISATGSGTGTSIGVYDETSFIGYPTAINFGSNLAVSSISSGIVTITGSSGIGTSYWVKNSVGIHTLDKVGIGTTNPTSNLYVLGNGYFTGILTATTFADINGNPITGAGGSSVILFDIPNTYYTCNTTATNNTGSNNIFFGASSGSANTSGNNNTFIGGVSGRCNLTGNHNNFFGNQSGFNNVSGCYNNYFGYQAGYCSTNSSNNIFIGLNAGYYGASTQGQNIALGAYSGYFNQSTSNAFVGSYSGCSNTSGCYNTFFGVKSGRNNTTGNYNIILGSNSANTTANTFSNRVIIGSGTSLGEFNSPVTNKGTQFAVGVRTDASSSKYWIVGNENFNIGIGTTNPTEKLFVGGNIKATGSITASNFFLSDGSSITGSGSSSPILVKCCQTFYTCNTSLQATMTGDHNFFFGAGSGCLATGNVAFNNAIGFQAGQSLNNARSNNFFGASSGDSVTTGCFNSFFGDISGSSITTGCYNVFLGANSGFGNVSGNNNIYIGSNSGSNTTASNKVIIGAGLSNSHLFDAPSPTSSTQLAIGNRQSTGNSCYWIVGNSSYNVGIGSTNPTSRLSVGGDGFFTGIVTASAFSGNGNRLTGIVTQINAGTGINVSSSTGSVTISAEGVSGNLSVDSINSSGIITASRFVSNVATGTPPLTVTSTTKVTNLNADLLDGYSVGTSGAAIPSLDGNNTWSNIQTFNSQVSISTSLVVSTNHSVNAVRITQAGSGNALVVEDDTNPDATPFVINNIGQVGINTTADSSFGLNVGGAIKASSYIQGTYFNGINSSQPAGAFNRTTTTGAIININYNTVTQGTISIASDGVTVQYLSFLGSHWSMLPSGEIENILPGTIMETIDELVDWKLVSFEKDGVILKQCYNGELSIGSTITITYEDQQYVGTIEKEEPELNIEKAVRVKVSDLEGSSAVYGVFLDWNNDNDEPYIGKWNNLNVASVGNYFIRINANEQVNIGDLIESAGNGCGKVQNDDIIRSKTVGKVTSTIKQKIYEDGSYLVTAVLYCG